MSTFRIKEGDIYPILQTTLYDASGPINLTAATGVQLVYKKRPGGSPVTKTGAIVTAASGVVKYEWASGDTDTVGFYDAEWVVTFTGGGKLTVPNNTYNHIEMYPKLSA